MFAAKQRPGPTRRAAICQGFASAESTPTARPTPSSPPHAPNTAHAHGSRVLGR